LGKPCNLAIDPAVVNVVGGAEANFLFVLEKLVARTPEIELQGFVGIATASERRIARLQSAGRVFKLVGVL